MVHVVPPKGSKREERVVLTLPDKTQYLVSAHISDSSTVYYFGSYASYCILCQVHHEDSPLRAFIDVGIANISNVFYDELCCVNRPFVRGDDTRMLFLVVMAYVQHQHPHIVGISFSDESTRTCDNGAPVDLAIMHYLKDGQTWYMSRFDARMSSEDETRFRAAEIAFQHVQIPWELMRSYMITDPLLPEEQLRRMFETSDLLTFFRSLAKTVGISAFCSFLSMWINDFMNRYFKFSFRNIKFTIFLDSHKIRPLPTFDISDPSKPIKRKNTRRRLRRQAGAWL